jgi:uncharacterized protein YjbI with pentapeptide repeats
MEISAEELLKRYAAGERDFSGIKLGNADFREINLSGAYLRGINLSGADLRGINLSNIRSELLECDRGSS